MITMLTPLLFVALAVLGCWAMARGAVPPTDTSDMNVGDDIVDQSALAAVALTIMASSEVSCASDPPSSSDCSLP